MAPNPKLAPQPVIDAPGWTHAHIQTERERETERQRKWRHRRIEIKLMRSWLLELIPKGLEAMRLLLEVQMV